MIPYHTTLQIFRPEPAEQKQKRSNKQLAAE
jgi:hypothetical protein